MPDERHVFALDFDGVVCDSADELYRTAFIAAKEVWPETFAAEWKWASMPDWLIRCTRSVRPVLETGFEGLLMVRVLVDAYIENETDPAPALATAVEEMLKDWNPESLAITMRRLNVKKNQLIEAFGSVRDQWMKDDMPGWLNSSHLYEGVADALKEAVQKVPIFIITTKEQRFAQAILSNNGVDLPNENVYGLGMYRNKLEVLQELANRPEYQGYTVHFIEDRYPTLEAIKPHVQGLNMELYLATWGYNTCAVREEAEKAGGIHLLSLQAFYNLLKGEP